MDPILKVLRERDRIYEETGKYLSYGKTMAKYPDRVKSDEIKPAVKKTGNYNRRLTKSELAEMELKYNARADPKHIAAELNISCTAVIQNLKRLGVYKTKSKIWTKEKDKLLTELYINGAPHEEMAKRLGYSKSSIYSRINKLGLAKRKRKELKQ